MAGEGVLILSKGEINHYLPTGFRSLEGAVELLKPENLVTWLEARREDAFLDGLEAIAYQVLGIPGGDQEEVHDAAGQLVKATAKPERRPSVRKTATDTSEASVQEKSV